MTGEQQGSIFKGMAWMLAAAVAMALGTVFSRYACSASHPVTVTGWHMLLGGLPLLLWHGLDPAYALVPPWGPSQWVLMAYASLLDACVHLRGAIMRPTANDQLQPHLRSVAPQGCMTDGTCLAPRAHIPCNKQL